MILSFVLYLVILLGLGLYAARFIKSLKGFLLADRSMGPFVTAMSAEASAMSGWLLIAVPARAFTYGLSAIWVGMACVMGDAVSWLAVSRRLRRQTERLRALTLPEYFEKRFAKEGGYAVQLVATLGIMVFMLIYLWAQFVAAGKAMSAILDFVDYSEATLLAAVIIIVYTLLGGFRAVAWTDFLQGFMMLLALTMLPLICLANVGGWSSLMGHLSQVSSEMPGTASSNLDHWFAGLTGLVLFTFLFEDAGVGVGYVGQPQLCARYMAVRKVSHLKTAFMVSVCWNLLAVSGAVLLGLTAHYWYRFVAGAGGTVESRLDSALVFNVEQVLPMMARQVLDPWVAGILVSATLAAIMSSADSFLLSAASSMTRDVYQRIFRQQASERELLKISRVVTVGLGTGALMLALSTDPWDPEATVYQLVLYAWGGLSACFTAPLVMALFYRKMTRAGCLAGILFGAGTSLVWRNVEFLSSVAYELIPSVIVSGCAIWLVSRLTWSGDPESH